MKILVDADACPVVNIVEKTAKQMNNIEVNLFCDTNHMLQSEYSEVKSIDAGRDAVDFAIVKASEKGDVVVTQDYGLAAILLGKGVYVIHQSGRWYTDENIDGLLMQRHISKKERRSSGKKHYKKIKSRTEEDDRSFEASLQKLLSEICNTN